MKHIKDDRVKVVTVVHPSDGTLDEHGSQRFVGKTGTVLHSHPIVRFGHPTHFEYTIKLDGHVANVAFVDEELEKA